MVSTPASAPTEPTRQGLDAEARFDRAVRLGSSVVLWLGLVLVTYWWDVGGGVSDLARWPDTLTSVGRLTGLWSADLLLVQVLLMSRLPVLEHAFGRDLSRTRRRTRHAAPVVDRAGISLFAGGHGVLVDALGGGGRNRTDVARPAAPLAQSGHGLRVTSVVRSPRMWCRST
jgi:hypothetical protein